MNANFLRLSQASELVDFARTFKQTLAEYDQDTLKDMLHHSWRPAKVAAWIIGLKRMEQLQSDIIEQLQTSPEYAEHLVVSLILLRNETSRDALYQFLEQSLTDDFLSPDHTNNFEHIDKLDRISLSVGWAFAGLEWLNSSLAKEGLHQFVSLNTLWDRYSQHWQTIVSRPLQRSGEDNVHSSYQHKWDLEAYRQDIHGIVRFCSDHFDWP